MSGIDLSVDLEGIKDYVTDGSGAIQIPTKDLDAGNHSVIISFDGNENYTEASKAVNISVLPSNMIFFNITSNDINYGEEAVIGFTLKNSIGESLSRDLEVFVGSLKEIVTVTDGVGELRINLTAENYLVTAVCNENNEFYTATSTFKVNKFATQIIFENMETIAVAKMDGRVGEWFTWTLKDSNGNPMANVPMQIGFNGVVYDEKNGIITDENGTAKLQINLGYKGDYTFAICFLGDENYNASFAVAKITVNCQTPKLAVPNKSYKATAKTKALTATFKTAKGTPVPNKKVSFTVNGKTYSAKTNDKGIATVNVSIAKAGSYAVTAKYAGDSTYSAVTAKATLKIS